MRMFHVQLLLNCAVHQSREPFSVLAVGRKFEIVLKLE